MPLTPSATRELLTRLGHFPKKFLGQNFLVDGNIVRKSLELAEVRNGDTVVEVGPGLGTLTQALLDAGADVWAVEFDHALHAHLSAVLQPAYPTSFHLLQGDAVEHPRAGLHDGVAFKVVANLPYAISTPWMEGILEGTLPDRMVLMLQQEAAQRYVARHGSKQFSAISIFLQSAFDAAPGHKVAAACFHPRPDVESFLLHLVRKPEPYVFTAPLRALIRACFQQRRKQVGALLRDKLPGGGSAWFTHLSRMDLGDVSVTPQTRPEDIPLRAWQELAPFVPTQGPF